MGSGGLKTRTTRLRATWIDDILTVPARRPIKPIYVKRFVSMMDSIIERAKNEENGGQSAA